MTIYTCEHCKYNYHPSCTVLKQVPNKADKLIIACRTCIATANANKQRNETLNANKTENQANATKSAHLTGSTSSNPSSDKMLSMLLGKMDKLDKLDGIETQISNFQTSLQDINDKIADFSVKLQVLESIPALIQRVDAAEENIDKLNSDFNSLRQIVDSQQCSFDSAVSVAVTRDRLQHLEELIASLSSRLSELADTQQRLSSDIVLGGFQYKSGVNLRDLALVILKTIHPDLESRNIISARPLRGKDRRKETSVPSSSSTAPMNTDIQTSTSEPATSSSTTPTDTYIETLTSEPTTSSFTHQQMIVSLSSPALVHAIIHSKIKLKKVHTSNIDKALLQSLGDPSPLALIVINLHSLILRRISAIF